MIHSFSLPVRLSAFAFAIALAVAFIRHPSLAQAQDGSVPVDAEMVESLMQEAPPVPTPLPVKDGPSGVDFLSLLLLGGAFMIPIGFMSMMVVALAVERTLALRSKRIIPRLLVAELEELSAPIDRFSPSVAFAICREYPSPAATAIEAMLMRTGQPISEIENAAMESIQREADDCAAPIRWLSFAANATPLLGLLGTVWGMIVTFHESTNLTADRSRSEQLSEGIYVALVTTLAGLMVAIPAALFAQYLENRLAKLFHRIERLTFDLAPGLARFAGISRLDQDGTLRPMLTAPGMTHNASPPISSGMKPNVSSMVTPVPPPVPPALSSKKLNR